MPSKPKAHKTKPQKIQKTETGAIKAKITTAPSPKEPQPQPQPQKKKAQNTQAS